MRGLSIAGAALLLLIPQLGVAQAPQPDTTQSVTSDWNELPLDKQERIRSYVQTQDISPVISGQRLSVGTTLPRTVPLRGLPRDMVTEVPRITSYRYVVLPEGIAIVEPSTRRIVQIIGL